MMESCLTSHSYNVGELGLLRMQKVKLEALDAATQNMRYFLSLNAYYVINTPYTVFLFLNNSLSCCLLAYSLHYYQNNFEKFGDAFYYFNLLIGSIAVALTGCVYKNELQKLVNDSCCTYDYQSTIMRRKLDEVEEEAILFTRIIFKGIICMMCFTVPSLNLLPFVEAYFKNEDVYLLFPCWFPFEVSNVPLQILVLLWQESVVLSVHFMGWGGMVVFYTAYSNIKAEVNLVSYAMKNIEPRALEMARSRKEYQGGDLKSDEILSRCYCECTRMCAQHHSDIVEYFSTISTGLGFIYSAAFFTGILAVTFGGYFVVSDNFAVKIKYGGLTFIILGMIYVYFLMGDSTTYDLLTVAQTAYTMEWYNLPKNCQSTLRLMQLKSNEPLFYKMALGQRVDMEAYMSLVKASYYYINMLIANNNEHQ